MRLVFLLLLLLNIALWPLTAGLVHFGGGQTEPFRLTSQIEPERLRIVPEDGAAATAPARTTEALAAEDERDPQAPACRVLTGLTREQADALAARARDRQPPVQLSESEQPGSSSWWVHIPDLQTRPLAERKQAELKALGVREMALMPDADGQKFAISLGLFKTEASARELLSRLSGQGVRSARIVEREAKATRLRVELRGAAADVEAVVADAGGVPDGVDAADCP